ncbi:MAG: transposase [Methylobacterium sp.]|nr:transposase [Methylobacterium sp.]
MTWTDIDRAELNRDALRFPSDLTAREWALIAPLGPSAKRGGQPRTTDMRDVVEAILFIASGGCQWRMLPPCFPPVSTMRGCFCAWRDTGLLASINHALVMTAPKIEGREASPGAARSHSNG